MKKWKLWNGTLLSVLGLLIIIFPEFWFRVVVILLGLGAIVYGVYNFKITKSVSDQSAYRRTILIKGVVSLIIGVCAILFPLALGQTLWAVMIWVLIGYLIVSAVLGFYAAALLRKTGIDRKKYIFENIALIFIAVVLILISPNTLGSVVIRIIGIVTMIIGLILLAFGILNGREKTSSVTAKPSSDVASSSEDEDGTVVYEVKDDGSVEEVTEGSEEEKPE